MGGHSAAPPRPLGRNIKSAFPSTAYTQSVQFCRVGSQVHWLSTILLHSRSSWVEIKPPQWRGGRTMHMPRAYLGWPPRLRVQARSRNSLRAEGLGRPRHVFAHTTTLYYRAVDCLSLHRLLYRTRTHCVYHPPHIYTSAPRCERLFGSIGWHSEARARDSGGTVSNDATPRAKICQGSV